MNIVSEGQRVLHEEANSINTLAKNLGEPFENAVKCLFSCKGRVALTGMGKSGYVARKIAATMSSTGSPAYFIHPAEASHGDLGMLSESDALIVISNSGNTSELHDIVLYAVNNNMTVIGITKNSDSFLGKNSTILLSIPQLGEACPLGCAPTSSTTAQMALGDAIAMVLLNLRGFTKDDFIKYHPGGSLGKQTQRVRDVMLTGKSIPVIREDEKIINVLLAMTKCHMETAPVVDDSNILLGIVMADNIRKLNYEAYNDATAKKMMTKVNITISPDDFVGKVKDIIHHENQLFQICVVDNGKLVGMITEHEI